MAVGIPGPVLSSLIYQLKSSEGDTVSASADQNSLSSSSVLRWVCYWENFAGRE